MRNVFESSKTWFLNDFINNLDNKSEKTLVPENYFINVEEIMEKLKVSSTDSRVANASAIYQDLKTRYMTKEERQFKKKLQN